MKSLLLRLAMSMTVVCFGSTTALAQNPDKYPDRPIKIIVPFPAGIAPDVMGRVIAEGLHRHLKVPVIVENRPGASGNIGTEAAAHSPADGYTLLVCGLSCASAETFYRNVNYNVDRDLAPIINMGVIPSVLVVSNRSPYKALGDLVADARAGKEMDFGSTGFGTSLHLAGELLKRATGGKMTHVPYSKSDPLLDVIAGRLTFAFIPGTVAVANKDRVRVLGVASRKREPGLPDVPTIGETFPGFLMEPWNGIWAPKGTPDKVLDQLNVAIQKILQEPDAQARMGSLGLTVVGGTRQEMKEYFEADRRRWREVGQANNIQPQD